MMKPLQLWYPFLVLHVDVATNICAKKMEMSKDQIPSKKPLRVTSFKLESNSKRCTTN